MCCQEFTLCHAYVGLTVVALNSSLSGSGSGSGANSVMLDAGHSTVVSVLRFSGLRFSGLRFSGLHFSGLRRMRFASRAFWKMFPSVRCLLDEICK